MTEPTATISESAQEGTDSSPTDRHAMLLPCPFCGRELAARRDGANPRAMCDTPNCMGGRLPVVNLDVPEDVAAWNARGGEALSAEGKEHAMATEAESIAGPIATDSLRLQAQIDILLERERKKVHEWYGHKLEVLKHWARQQPEDIQHDVFSCLANGQPRWDEQVNFGAQLSQAQQAHKRAESEVLDLRRHVDELKAELEKTRRQGVAADLAMLVLVEDLAMLVVRLAKHLSRSAPDSDLPGKAMDYLKRKKLTGNLLRLDGERE